MTWRATTGIFGAALLARSAVAVWAGDKFPPVADGVFYERFAERLASGAGYTVQWPDGVVTYAAHYPVGYPAMLALAYVVFGSSVRVAVAMNALVGAAAAACGHRLALHALGPRRALVAGLLLALDPSLLLYTPAVMTEGIAGALVVIALAVGPGRERSWGRAVAMGLVFGLATLVRPQVLVLVPVLAWVFAPDPRWKTASVALAVALVSVSPWTARNCVRMHRCALVSVNGGWNLLIGAQTTTGTWTELVTPEDCRTVWDEAEKDRCFEHAARRDIVAHPWAWFAKAPRKLGATFAYFVAGAAYLHRSNPQAFDDGAVVRWGAVELVAGRLLLLGCLLGLLWSSAPGWRRVLLGAGMIAAVTREHAWMGYAALAVAWLVMPDVSPGARRLQAGAAVMLVATLATHAVFFGAARYALIVLPLQLLGVVASWSEGGVTRRRSGYSDGVDATKVIAGSNEREESPSSTEYGAG